jgi:serine/tyrosine/threonine adenylyltransferase
MATNRADFTLTFRGLSDAALDASQDERLRQLFADPAAYDEWSRRWRQRIGCEPQAPTERAISMRSVNPAFIPRNHRIEAVIQAAVSRHDYAPFEELLQVLSKPYEDSPTLSAYADPPEPGQRVLQTFCGT